MRLLITGSRSFDDERLLWSVLTGYYDEHSVAWQAAHLEPFVLIHGAAKGADTIADSWAANSPLHGELVTTMPSTQRLWEMRACPVVLIAQHAKWQEHAEGWCPGAACLRKTNGRYCVAAGGRRNQAMLDEHSPSHAHAFVDKALEQSKGTHDMVKRLKAAGLRVPVTRIY